MAMKVAGICFTQEGASLIGRLEKVLRTELPENTEISWYGKGKYLTETVLPLQDVQFVEEPVQEWAGEQFKKTDVLIFVGAAGIAVRAIAPFVKDKRTDPAVIVLDERGKFCISLLSGHIGGANAIVTKLSAGLGCIPVITTATDVSQRFAVDTYAVSHGMTISNMTYAKEVSAALLAGEPVGFYTNFPVNGACPEGIFWSDKLEQARQDRAEHSDGTTLGIYISPSYHRAYFDHTLWLIPKCLIVGIGCKRGTPAAKIERLVKKTLDQYSLYIEAVEKIATIDLKANEEGLLQFCNNHDLPFETYSAEALQQVPGDFTSSNFVESKVGVSNVCERSAMCGGGDQLIIRKTAEDGVTVAVALHNITIDWN